MLDKLFKKDTDEDIIKELKSTSFNEDKVNSMLQHVNINHKNNQLQNFLHIIIPDNMIESVKCLLSNKINYNAADAHGMTPMMVAAKYGHSGIVEELLNVGANVNFEEQNGYTAIEFAILNNHFRVFQQLKPYVTNLNRRNNENETLLHLAIKAQNIIVVNDLLEDKRFQRLDEILFYKETYSNTEILNNVLKSFDDIHKKIDSYGRNLLFYVIENGIQCLDVFYYLVRLDLDIDCIDIEGNNILLHLIDYIIKRKAYYEEKKEVEKGELEIKNLIALISKIIEEDINLNVCNNKNETVLSLPAKHKALDILIELLDYEVNIDIQNRHNETTISEIAIKGDEYRDVLNLLLDYGANVNIRDRNETTVIEKLIDAILAINNNKKLKGHQKKQIDFNTDYKITLTTFLLNADVNLTLLNSIGEPYFFEAVRYGNLDLCKLLMKYGSEINQTDINGENIIYRVMDENQSFSAESELKSYRNILQTVIMMGANVNAKDSYGGITLHKAILNCDQIAIKLLIHSGADINAIDNRGRNIIHNAVWKNNLKVFKQVYSYNKKALNEVDKFGVLPINYAAFLGYIDFVIEFIELSAHVNNPKRKTKYILNFLKKFHQNLQELEDKARTKSEKNKVQILVENMMKEFEVN